MMSLNYNYSNIKYGSEFTDIYKRSNNSMLNQKIN